MCETCQDNSPSIIKFFTWVTARDKTVPTIDNYWAYLYVNSYGSSQVKITYWKDDTYLKGMGIVILLINKDATLYFTVA